MSPRAPEDALSSEDGLPSEDALVLDPYRGHEDDPPVREGGWVAAVSVILRGMGGLSSAELLLIRRSAHPEDPWSGHMALPGGRRDLGDASLLETAIRETREEVGIELSVAGRVLGALPSVAPRNAHLPRLTILPLVFAVPAETAAFRAAPDEVDEIHWVSVAHLLNPAHRKTVRFPELGDLSFPAFDVGGRDVWGLTHRVVTELLRRGAPRERGD